MSYPFSCLILYVLLAVAVYAYSIEDESKLQTDLLSGYNVNVRPANQVSILCALTLTNLLSLDIVDQTLVVAGSLGAIWYDRRLSWNESQNGNVSSLYYKSDQIWRPTLVLQNSVTGIEVIGDNGNQKSIPMSVRSDGLVIWLAPAYFSSYCSVDISKFPFDTQTCELVISSWLFSSDSLKLVNLDQDISMDRLEKNGEYDIVRSYTRVDAYLAYSSSSVENIVFGIELRRKYSYYLLNVVLPVFFMQLLGLVVFVVPTESGEKLTFALTLLLSLTVMMTLVAEKIPTTSLQIPTLSIYMLGGTVISSLELIMTVIILHFKHYDKEGSHVTRRMQSLATILALLTCTKRNKIESKPEAFSKSSNSCGIIIVEEIKNVDELEKAVQDTEESDGTVACAYTYEDIAAMLNKFSIVLFSVVTLLFTFSMLVMIV